MTDPYPPDGRPEPAQGGQPEAPAPTSAAAGPPARPASVASTSPAGPDPGAPDPSIPSAATSPDTAPLPSTPVAGGTPYPGAPAQHAGPYPGVPAADSQPNSGAPTQDAGPYSAAPAQDAGPYLAASGSDGTGSVVPQQPDAGQFAEPPVAGDAAPEAAGTSQSAGPYPPAPTGPPYPPTAGDAPYPPAPGQYPPAPESGLPPVPGAEQPDGGGRWSDGTSAWSAQPPVGQPGPQPGAQPPLSGMPGQPMLAGPGWQPPAPQRGRLGTVVAVLAVVLVVVTVVQTVLLVETNSALGDQKKAAAAARAKSDRRLAKLENDVGGLQQRAKRSLDSAGVAAKVLPSVFQVDAGEYSGTAFVVGSAPGGGTYLLTNHHVVEHLLASGSKSVKLERSGGSYPAKVVKYDSGRDIALLQCDESFGALGVVDKPVRSGEPVVVVGSPLGLGDSVTAGVISSPEREVPGSDEKFIQFDAAINPGNSGGPVLNAKGQVVGIATEKARDAEGIGLAIPISIPCDKFSVCGK
ncbi:trypsin-like peptidase domain-containing protein [Actinocatenispora thailandica]|nr:trypsin-like peptidase domain-containing protein [Actinocatenispora thailandica]